MRHKMSPSRTKTYKRIDLAKRVRSQFLLYKAWRHVEARASSSKDGDTKEALASFRQNPGKQLKQIQSDLAQKTFVFAPQRGVLKKRSGGKRPRPLVIAPIANRIVQRAVLEVCQSDEKKIRQCLGLLPTLIEQPTSVGGLPEKGVNDAIQQIKSAIMNGAKWYVRSDLHDFFRHVSKDKIKSFLEENIVEFEFVELFMHALSTELSNEESVRQELDLFPLGEEGVPQGSALSALCANIILAKFDQKLNGRGITTIRYLDDFVILAPTKATADKVWTRALALLKEVNLEAHDPDKNNGKASRGKIADGFEYLSFRIDLENVAPSRDARGKFIDGITKFIADSKASIQAAGSDVRRAQPMYLQSLVLLDRRIRGWGDAFSSTTLRVVFSQLDSEIDKKVQDYNSWFVRHTKEVAMKGRRRKLGIALLSDTLLLNDLIA